MQDTHIKDELKEKGKTVPSSAFSEGKPRLEPAAACEGTTGKLSTSKHFMGIRNYS